MVYVLILKEGSKVMLLLLLCGYNKELWPRKAKVKRLNLALNKFITMLIMFVKILVALTINLVTRMLLNFVAHLERSLCLVTLSSRFTKIDKRNSSLLSM
jgi:hypothetical protein